MWMDEKEYDKGRNSARRITRLEGSFLKYDHIKNRAFIIPVIREAQEQNNKATTKKCDVPFFLVSYVWGKEIFPSP